MAYVHARRDKDGNIKNYRLVVSDGFRYSTWTPPNPNMSEKQMEREVMAAAFKFEEAIQAGYEIDKVKKFCDYAEYVLELKQRTGLAPTTLERYRSMLPRSITLVGASFCWKPIAKIQIICYTKLNKCFAFRKGRDIEWLMIFVF